MRQTTPIAPERRTASERRGDQRCGGEGAPRTPTSRATASEGRGMRGSWRSEMRGRGRSPHPHLSCHGRGSEGRGDHLGCASEDMVSKSPRGGACASWEGAAVQLRFGCGGGTNLMPKFCDGTNGTVSVSH